MIKRMAPHTVTAVYDHLALHQFSVCRTGTKVERFLCGNGCGGLEW